MDMGTYSSNLTLTSVGYAKLASLPGPATHSRSNQAIAFPNNLIKKVNASRKDHKPARVIQSQIDLNNFAYWEAKSSAITKRLRLH